MAMHKYYIDENIEKSKGPWKKGKMTKYESNFVKNSEMEKEGFKLNKKNHYTHSQINGYSFVISNNEDRIYVKNAKGTVEGVFENPKQVLNYLKNFKILDENEIIYTDADRKEMERKDSSWDEPSVMYDEEDSAIYDLDRGR